MTIWRSKLPLGAKFGLTLIVALVLWYLFSSITWSNGLPSVYGILAFLNEHYLLIATHSWHTAIRALLGITVALVISTILISLFFVHRHIALFFTAPFMAFFAVPVTIVAPIAYLKLDVLSLTVLTAVLTVTYPFTIASTTKIQEVSNQYTPLFKSLGACWLTRLLKLRLPAFILAVTDGLQLMVPWALLGVMLGEYAGGTDSGLGNYLIGLMGNGDPNSLWAITLVVTFFSLLIYWVLGQMSARIQIKLRLRQAIPATSSYSQTLETSEIVVMLVGGLVSWEVLRALSGLQGTQFPGLFDLWRYIRSEGVDVLPNYASVVSSVSAAVCALAIAVTLAGALALLSYVAPRWRGLTEAGILLFQVVPIVAMLPILSLLLGRTWGVGVVMGVLATVFPAYSIMLRRLHSLPTAYPRMLVAFGASENAILTLLLIPWMVDAAGTALRVGAPRVLVGVILAESLLSGTGMGDYINGQFGAGNFRGLAVAALITIAFAGLFLAVASFSEPLLHAVHARVFRLYHILRKLHHAS